jgi:hypothetical protein
MRSRAFSLRRFLLGDPLASSQLIHEKIPKVKALAVFSSDALSSVAYATEEILFVLAAAGSLPLEHPTIKRFTPIQKVGGPTSSPRTTSERFSHLSQVQRC